MISFVVYATGRITCYSVNMLRWAGRASLVIMNQEENGLNADTGSEDNYNVNVFNTALGGAKLLYKFTLLAKATDINLIKTNSSILICWFFVQAITTQFWEIWVVIPYIFHTQGGGGGSCKFSHISQGVCVNFRAFLTHGGGLIIFSHNS